MFSFLAPIACDDEYFRMNYLSLNGGSSSFSIAAMKDFATFIWQTENGRLANYISPLFSTIMPRMAGAIILGAAITLMITGAARLAVPYGRIGWKTITAVCCGTIFALPWHENIILVDYTLNYPFAACLEIWFLYVMMYGLYRKSKYLRGTAALCLYVLLALCAGSVHEGFAVPVFCGLAVIAIRHRFSREAKWWILFAVFTIGMMSSLLSPGIWERADVAGGSTIIQKIIRGKHVIAFGMGAIVCLAAAVATGLLHPATRKRLDAIYKEDRFIALFVIMTVSAAIAMYTSYARGAWIGELSAIIMLVSLVRETCTGTRFKRIKSCIATVMLLVTSAFCIGNVYWQYRFHIQDREITTLLEQSADGCVYFDGDFYPPVYTLQQPFHLRWISNFALAAAAMNDSLHNRIRILPTDFSKHVEPTQCDAVAGTAGACYLNGHLIVKEWEKDICDMGTIYVTRSDGKRYGMYCSFVEIPELEGMYLVRPHSRRHIGKYIRVDAGNM